MQKVSQQALPQKALLLLGLLKALFFGHFIKNKPVDFVELPKQNYYFASLNKLITWDS
jgi:hypothetical protein